MPEPPALVVSDAHLGGVPEPAARTFLAFLEHVPELSHDLVIDGDLFDFWFEYRSVVLREHFAVLRVLADLVDAGVRIRLAAGNHDAWGGSFLRDEVGLELLPGESRTTVGGRRTYLAHGDGLAGGDWGYRFLKRVTRSRLGAGAFRWLHPDLAARIVRGVSGTAERHARGPGGERERADRLSRHAAELLRDDPDLELVVFGHAHRPELREVAPGRFYLNPGDWIHHCTFGLVWPGRVELRAWRDGSVRPIDPG